MHESRASHFLCCAGLLGLALLLPRAAAATWPADPFVNVPLCTAAGDQSLPAMVADGTGGAIVAWQDSRSDPGDIYAQRVSAIGVVQWPADGVALCTAGGDQDHPGIVADGAGGAIVAWEDYRGDTADIYVQRVSAAGTVQWATGGVALCTARADQLTPTLVPDGAGGAIVAWTDQRDGGSDVYAQRISAAGAVQWTRDGVALCTAAGNQGGLTLVADGAGGAIVAWYDFRSGTSFDIYAQRISAGGAVQWTADGVALCTAPGDQGSPTMTTDGAHGAIVGWDDSRGAPNVDIYAQRISAGGAVQWTADGAPVCTAAGQQWTPVIAADGAGGAIAAWYDYRSSIYSADIYAQRISAGGAVQWATEGVALCTDPGDQYGPAITTDGAGGAIVAWDDLRSGTDDVYAQRISPVGAVQWTPNGVGLCTAAGLQQAPALVPDGAGGAIATWYDDRNGNDDIYAQRVQPGGQLGGDALSVPEREPLACALEPVRPNPARGGALRVRFTLAGGAGADLELLDVAGRRVAAREVGSLGAGPHSLDLGEDARLAPGLYLVRLSQGASAKVTRVAVLR